MIKKLDKLQISLILIYIILSCVMLIVPYRESIETGALKHGYNHLMNWTVVIYSLRVLLNSFGWELFGVEKHLFAIIGVELSGIYAKVFIFKESYDVVWTGIISEVAVVIIFCGLAFIDKTLYYTGNKKDYDILMNNLGQED